MIVLCVSLLVRGNVMAFLHIGPYITYLSDSGHFQSRFLLSTSHCNKRCWRTCAIKINLTHAQLVCYCLIILCNKPIRSVIATSHTIQINGSCDQTFKIDLFLVQALRSCNHTCTCNSWCCVYMAIHMRVCQDKHVCTYGWFARVS